MKTALLSGSEAPAKHSLAVFVWNTKKAKQTQWQEMELWTEGPVNGGRNSDGPKVAKFIGT